EPAHGLSLPASRVFLQSSLPNVTLVAGEEKDQDRAPLPPRRVHYWWHNRSLILMTFGGILGATICFALVLLLGWGGKPLERKEPPERKGSVQYLKSQPYWQAIVVTGNTKTVYVDSQGLRHDKPGAVIGKGDINAQADQARKNLEEALTAAGANR